MSNSTQGYTWYTYDALDRRTAAGFTPYWPEYFPGLPTDIAYHHDGPEVAVQYQTADWETWTAWDIVNGPGLDEPVMRTDGTSRYYYHADALGSVVALTDNTGAVAEQYRYDAWGHMAAGDGAGNGIVPGTVTGNLTTFTGREYDPIAGLYYYRARYYHPAMGRFISRDPIGEAGGLNLYAYCGNDPVNFWDPWGEWEFRRRRCEGMAGTVADAYYGKGDPRGQHAQFFYDDGTNSGYLGDKDGKNQFGEDSPKSLPNYGDPVVSGRDDDRLKEAERNVQRRWREEGRRYKHPDNDCQTYAGEVLSELERLRREERDLNPEKLTD